MPAFWTPSAREAEAANTAVRLAAQDVERSTDKLAVATNRWEEFLRTTGNTMKRYTSSWQQSRADAALLGT